MARRYYNLLMAMFLSVVIIGASLLTSGGLLYLLILAGHFGLLILAILLFVFRLAGFIFREKFVYILAGSINLLLGLVAIILFMLGNVTENLPQTMAINLVIGLIVLLDAVVLKRKPYEIAAHKRS